MPLPAALASRLAKRGLILASPRPEPVASSENTSPNTPTTTALSTNNVVEEIIAEDYDNPKPAIANEDDDMGEDLVGNLEQKLKGHIGCPNKYNIFHECNNYCQEVWGNGHALPDANYLLKKQKLLSQFPLPEGWTDVYDPGTGRHYYWEKESDVVSWLPPLHPAAVLTESAAHLREEMKLAEGDDEDDDEDEDDDDDDDEEGGEEDEEQDSNMEDEPMSEDDVKKDEAAEDKERKREARERQRAKGRTKVRDNDIDPMDPAAYSDTPRGNWSTGLGKKNEAKTGADTTAAGTLYQMRPYPSPGAVLRANAKTKGKPGKAVVSFPQLPPT